MPTPARLAILVLVVALVFFGSPIPTTREWVRPIFGFDSALGSLDAGQRGKALDLMTEAGATWTRIGAYWPYIDREVKSRPYVVATSPRDWSVMDTYVEDASRRRLTIVGAVSGYADWANGKKGPYVVPTDTAEFVAFTKDAVARYKGKIRYWEIWNEPNAGFWKPAPDAVAYARLLRAAYYAVKEVDPEAKVVGGALYRNDYAYLAAMYGTIERYPDAPTHDYFFDYLSVHPYCDDRAPDDADSRFINRYVDKNFTGLAKMKTTMETFGDTNKHILVTEMAWPVSDMPYTRGVGLKRQAEYLAQAYGMAQRWPWLDAMLWYGVRDYAGDEKPFSLIGPNLRPRPSYYAFKKAALGL